MDEYMRLIIGVFGIVFLPAGVFGGGPHYCSPGYANPCQNGAICQAYNSGYNYNCVCQNGWTGTNCDVRDCKSNLYCVNGGTCSASGSSYTCQCADGFTGSNCEDRDCSSSLYCINGGTCLPAGPDYSCQCADGYKGDNCEKIDCDSPVWCVNGGTCKPSSDQMSKTCDCYYGWTGDNCEDIDVCTPHVKADIVFVLDASISSGNDSFSKQKSLVKEFVSKFRVGPLNYRYQFALLTFSYDPVVHFQFDTYQNNSELIDAIEKISHIDIGPTLTDKALRMVREDVLPSSRPGAAKYVIVITDGLSSNGKSTETEASKLKRFDDVTVIAVGLGHFIGHEELLTIASHRKLVYNLHNKDALHAVLENSMTGCKDCMNLTSDVAVVFDVSLNSNYGNFDTQMTVAEQIFQITPSGPNGTQFSYITFSDINKNVFSFGQYMSYSDMIIDLNRYTKFGQNESHASDVFQYVRNQVFVNSNGHRDSARKVLVVISPGVFNDIQRVQKEAEMLKQDNVTLVTVGAGTQANFTALKALASDSALVYSVGPDVYRDTSILWSLLSTFEYEYCQNV